MTPRIRSATAGDLPGALALLAHADLPVADLSHGHLAFVAEDDGGLAGVIGLETHGSVGLLRSLVVAGSQRTKGLGGRLVAALEDLARERGIEQLWLLTIDADSYFLRLGYVVESRNDVPAEIRDTAEFSSLCPGSAVLMSKSL